MSPEAPRPDVDTLAAGQIDDTPGPGLEPQGGSGGTVSAGYDMQANREV